MAGVAVDDEAGSTRFDEGGESVTKEEFSDNMGRKEEEDGDNMEAEENAKEEESAGGGE